MKMRYAAILLAACLALSGCRTTSSTTSGFSGSSTAYFPSGVFDSFKTEWYCSHLGEMKEPRLAPDTLDRRDSRVYRFTELATFRGNLVVRLHVRNDGSGEVEVKRYDGGQSTGWRAGKRVAHRTQSLTPDQVRDIDDSFSKLGFWTMPSTQEDQGLDGSQWIIEAATTNDYHVVNRWFPDEGAFVELSMLFFGLAEKAGAEMY